MTETSGPGEDLPADAARQLAQLDEIERLAREILEEPHYHLHDGRPVPDPATGLSLRDHGPDLRAIDALLGVTQARSAILGLDAPVRYELVDPDGNTMDVSRIAGLVALLRQATEQDPMDDSGSV